MSTARDLVEVTADGLREGDRDGGLGRGRRVLSSPRRTESGRIEVEVAWSTGRRERLALDPSRRFPVSRVVAGPNLPLRFRSRSKVTRGMVEVHDAMHVEAVVDPVHGHRWVVRCQHDTRIGRATLDAATSAVEDPRLWCVECVELGPRPVSALF